MFFFSVIGAIQMRYDDDDDDDDDTGESVWVRQFNNHGNSL